jgi:hypothetical protein
MKAEAWVFGSTAIFFILIAPVYWLTTGEWAGTTALVMTALLVTMITVYLGFHAMRMDPRPEDRLDAEIADGAGELGFFPPYSWWPLWVSLTFSVITYAVALGQWWLVLIGFAFGFIAVCGWVFEYYRGEHAH